MAPPQGQATAKTPSQRVLEYATTHLGQKVGRGECWDLPFYALKASGAATPHDLGKDLYVWGDPIDDLADAQPGDILQFEKVRIHREWVDGKFKHTEDLNFATRHSAIVERVEKGLWFTILNEHVNNSKKVTRLRINLSPENITQGKIHLYRPRARNGNGSH
jgi:hypothetical protein